MQAAENDPVPSFAGSAVGWDGRCPGKWQVAGALPAADTTQRRPLAAALDGAQSAVPQATLSLSFGLTGMAADPSVALKSAREIRCLVSHSAIAES